MEGRHVGSFPRHVRCDHVILYIRWPCKMLLSHAWSIIRSPSQTERLEGFCLGLWVKTNTQSGFYHASNPQDNIHYHGNSSFAEIAFNHGSSQLCNSRGFVVFHCVWIYGEVISLSCRDRGVFNFQSVVFSLFKEKDSWETREKRAVETNEELCCKTCGNY